MLLSVDNLSVAIFNSRLQLRHKKKRQAENRLNTPPAVEVMQKNTPKCCHTQATEEYSEETLLGCNLLSRQRHVYMQHLTNVPSQSWSSWRKKKYKLSWRNLYKLRQNYAMMKTLIYIEYNSFLFLERWLHCFTIQSTYSTRAILCSMDEFTESRQTLSVHLSFARAYLNSWQVTTVLIAFIYSLHV
jgi:hypothetical protein